MRALVFTLAVVMATIGGAQAAQSTWLGDLLGLHRHAAPARHHAAPKSAHSARPAALTAPVPAPVSARPPNPENGSDTQASEPASAPEEAKGAAAPPQPGAAPTSEGSEGGETAPKADGSPHIPLPEARPAPPAERPEPEPPSAPSPASPGTAAPQSGPARVFQTACPAVVSGAVDAKPLPPVSQGQCVARSPLGLAGVMVEGREIAVRGGVETDCAVATSLGPWLSAVDGYAVSRLHSHLAAITVGGSFVCRDRRTGEPNDTLSEHAFADALDVLSFTLENGRTIAVAPGWIPADGEDGRMLRFAHNAACSVFMTTLGPEANALHANHFHVDMGCHGMNCTYRMCQ